MSYTKTNWQTGDVIDAEKLNKMEQGIEDANGMLDGDTVTSASDTDTAFINQNNVLNKITLPNLVTYIKNKIGSLKNPNALTFTGAVNETYDGSEAKTINIPSGGTGTSYVLPVASADTLGGVKPIVKTDDMTQEVGVNESGALFTKAGGGGVDVVNSLGDGLSLIYSHTVTADELDVTYFYVTIDLFEKYTDTYIFQFVSDGSTTGNWFSINGFNDDGKEYEITRGSISNYKIINNIISIRNGYIMQYNYFTNNSSLYSTLVPGFITYGIDEITSIKNTKAFKVKKIKISNFKNIVHEGTVIRIYRIQ